MMKNYKIAISAVLVVSSIVGSLQSSADVDKNHKALQPKQTFQIQDDSGLKAACGSDSSISAALDQCGKKGFKWASCKKKGGNWTCSGASQKTDPTARSTTLKIAR